MRKFILIRWHDSIETVDAQLGPNPKDNEIEQVTTYYPAEEKIVICNTTSQRCIEKDGSQALTIICSIEKNPEISGDSSMINVFGPPEDWYWGTWNITVAADLNSANAYWSDQNPEYSGDALQCTVLSQELFQNSGLEFIIRRKREQAEFKKSLLSLDHGCAITAEKTVAVLDAAHIIEKPAGGAESVGNGILLRADIHRLYDRKFFEIRQDDGSIEIRKSLSPRYEKILTKAKVSQNILFRIKDALAERARLRESG
jgi:hypothetical protein